MYYVYVMIFGYYDENVRALSFYGEEVK